MIGGGVKRLIERGLSLQGRTFKPADIDDLFRDYVAHYAEHIADRSRAFPGVENALDTWPRRGDRFAVCTNKLAWLSVRLLDALGLSPRFAAICGQDTFGMQKPDPEVLRRTIRAAGGALDGRSHGGRLGDRHHDGARGGHAGCGGRLRLHRSAGGRVQARPDHQPFRCPAGSGLRADGEPTLTPRRGRQDRVKACISRPGQAIVLTGFSVEARHDARRGSMARTSATLGPKWHGE